MSHDMSPTFPTKVFFKGNVKLRHGNGKLAVEILGQADPIRGLYLAKEQMKDIVEVKFGSGAPFALLKMAENGLTNIGLLQRSYKDIMGIKKHEANDELTRTLTRVQEI